MKRSTRNRLLCPREVLKLEKEMITYIMGGSTEKKTANREDSESYLEEIRCKWDQSLYVLQEVWV